MPRQSGLQEGIKTPPSCSHPSDTLHLCSGALCNTDLEKDLEGVKDSQPHSRLPLSLRRGESHRFITHHHNPNLVFCWKLFNGSCAEPTPPFPNRMWFCSCNHHPFPSRIQLPHRQPVPLFPSPLLISDPKVPPRCSGPPYLTRVTSQGRGSRATHQHSCPG